MDSPKQPEDTPLSVCHFYRQVCDLPAEVDPAHLGRITLRAGRVCGLMMPAFIGSEVKAWMQRHGHQAEPVLTHPRSQRWTFLTGPDLPEDIRLFAEMSRLSVSIVRAGDIALPGPGQRPGLFRAWVQPPHDAYRPPGRIVIEAIRGCARQHARHRRRVVAYA
ncbi:DNA-directed RNA polymerase subunit beta [Nocardia sp. NBC_00508]|uniref:DNA-directed RNA polymerase subunit beta n=1 Tax=Nocardia sp. NBC_00508 TaxID=2975992 RepID=UPI002E806ED6|nr:DNA-directed RNA polymerase subunit beta [Nocardia sp. NBC_00508]WUD64613.1 DNA-directed RNA polymerase subunit beta [Nocardia sp. NBC_00508]